jgi:LuxR family maltose regulon positive regulatory protein
LSLNTIKAYNKNLYRKLGVNSRQDAVAVARQLGLI